MDGVVFRRKRSFTEIISSASTIFSLLTGFTIYPLAPKPKHSFTVSELATDVSIITVVSGCMANISERSLSPVTSGITISRVITVGDKPIAAMYRKSTGGFKTNIALGADPELCEITSEMEELAINASKAMGGGILGIDMMEDEDKGLIVHEVNNTVEFKGLARVAKRNIPREMIEFALNYIRK